MTSDLFFAAIGREPPRLRAVVPPACWRQPTLARVVRTAREVVLEAGPWRPRGPASYFVPSLSAPGISSQGIRFELSVRRGGRWSPWVGTLTLGSAPLPPVATESEGLRAEIDCWRSEEPVAAVRLRVRVAADDPRGALSGSGWLALSASDAGPVALPAAAGRIALAVPPLSQMSHGGLLGRRLCSPTSVAMVLAHLGLREDVARLAGEMYAPAADRFGVWPAAIAAAARRGVLGYILRFPDWGAAAWCLAQGLPIVASLRYRAGELSGAAVAETDGHLVVLTGQDHEAALVNDPAAPEDAAVPRRYALGEFVRVWLERTGVGYVLFKPEAVGMDVRGGSGARARAATDA